MGSSLLRRRCLMRSLSLLMRSLGLRVRSFRRCPRSRRRRGSVVLWCSLARRRIVCLSPLLLWLRRRTRWRSATLCLVRLRNIVRLRRWAVVSCVGVRRRSGRMLLHNLLMRCVIRRMRYVVVRLPILLVRSVVWLR